MSRPPYPPDYIEIPMPILHAAVPDGLIVTMIRIVGLCWAHRCWRSPAYTPAELVELLGRSRTTLDRHLGQLRRLGWLQVDRCNGRLVLRPTIRVSGWHERLRPSGEPARD